MDVIRFQPGETLTEILDSSAGTEQVRNNHLEPTKLLQYTAYVVDSCVTKPEPVALSIFHVGRKLLGCFMARNRKRLLYFLFK